MGTLGTEQRRPDPGANFIDTCYCPPDQIPAGRRTMTTVRSTRERDSLATSTVAVRRRQPLTRRRILQATGGLAVAAGLGAGARSAPVAAQGNVGGTLTILCWQGYDGPNANKPFVEQTGTKINAIYLGSNDEIFANLRAGG